MEIKEAVYCTTRTSTRDNGGSYDSGFMALASLKVLVQAAEQAGQDAIGFIPKHVKGSKVSTKTNKVWEGTVIEIKAFKLKPKE